MHAIDTISDKDVQKCLNDCQHRQYPYTFWDENEVDDFDLAKLPVLTKGSIDWTEDSRSEGLSGVSVDLNDAVQVEAFKDYAKFRIAELLASKKEVGFALTSLHSGKAKIQIYTK